MHRRTFAWWQWLTLAILIALCVYVLIRDIASGKRLGPEDGSRGGIERTWTG